VKEQITQPSDHPVGLFANSPTLAPDGVRFVVDANHESVVTPPSNGWSYNIYIYDPVDFTLTPLTLNDPAGYVADFEPTGW
jgi:hypothetical protein